MAQISARLHAVPARQGTSRPTAVSLVRRLSIGARFARQRQFGGQEAIANPAHRLRMLGFQALRASQRGHVNINDLNRRAGSTVDQVLPDLAALANGVVVSLTARCSLMAAGRPIREQRDDFESLRHGLHAGDKCGCLGAHGAISVEFHEQHIGPLALKGKRVFSA